MNDSNEITSGDVDADNANIILIKNILVQLKNLKLKEQYFIIHEIFLLLSSVNRNECILQQIISKFSDHQSLANKLLNKEVKHCLSYLIKTCFSSSLPPCCFARLMDYLIARRDAACLVGVGVDLVRRVVGNKNPSTTTLIEQLKAASLVTQSHQNCLVAYISNA